MHEGDRVDRFCVLVEGMVEWVRNVGGEEFVMASRPAVTYFGAMNLLLEEASQAGGRAVVDSRMIVVPGDQFRRLLRDEPSVLKGALRVIAPVHQGAEAVLREREKLVALGTLSAGLAHELNNPASAARRSASDLARAFEVLQGTLQRFVSSGVEREDAEVLVALQLEALDRAKSPGAGPGDGGGRPRGRPAGHPRRARARGLEAGPRAGRGGRRRGVARPARAPLRHARSPPRSQWVVASLTARGLVADLHESTARISEIVAAVKDYTYMDRAQTQSIDIHDGIESTLVMLAHKLKKGDVKLVREFDRSLPQITAHASQLNQVWTNLLDNAIDALDGSGTIRVQHGAGRRLGRRGRLRRRAGGPARDPEPPLRALLHHEGGGPRDRPRTRHRAADRREPPRPGAADLLPRRHPLRGAAADRVSVALATAAPARGLDDDLTPLGDALAARGVAHRIVDWDDPAVDWAAFALVVVRSVWDYPRRREEFLGWAGRVAARTALANPPELLRWSSDKRYMADLAAAGVPVVPSAFAGPGEEMRLAGRRGDRRQAGRVGGVARHQPPPAGAPRRGDRARRAPARRGPDRDGAALPGGRRGGARRDRAGVRGRRVQPRDPQGPDARARASPIVGGLYVEEDIRPATPTAAEHAVAATALAAIPGGAPLYARVNLVPDAAGAPVVLELELVEPSLFLVHDAGAADRVAAAIAGRLTSGASAPG